MVVERSTGSNDVVSANKCGRVYGAVQADKLTYSTARITLKAAFGQCQLQEYQRVLETRNASTDDFD